MNRRIVSFIAGMTLSLSVLPLVHAAPGDGVPFEQLQQQIDTLNAQVQALAEQVNQGVGDQVISVDCGAGSIGSALARARPGGSLTITVVGTCTEDVTIARNDVTLQGSGQVVGQITVDGAQRVVITGVTVTGPGSGIEARGNAAITVRNTTVENNAIFGIDVRQGAFAVIDGSMIRSNGQCDVLVRDSGNARIVNNTVQSDVVKPTSCDALVGAFRDSRIRMGGNTIINNVPSGFAVDVEHGSTLRQDQGHDTITGNARVINTANADFRDMEITGAVQVAENANFRTRSSTITGDITIAPRSLAVFNSSATVNGFVHCRGSATVGLDPVTGLTLVDSQGGPVSTSEGGLGWAFRAAVFGAPTFGPGGGFNGCN